MSHADTLSLPPGRYIDLPGRGRTFYREVEGPPGAPVALLLHGWTATADVNFHPYFDALGAHFRVIAPDHRGHGRGLRSPDRFSFECCADDAAALCRALGLGPVVTVGYSMGGALAQLLWHRHPSLVSGLVLCATASMFSDGLRDAAMFGLLNGVAVAGRRLPPHLQRKVAMRLLGTRRRELDEWVISELQLHDWAAVTEAGLAIGRFDSRSWVGSIDVPTAVVITLEDDVVDPMRQLRMARSIPSSTITYVEGDHAVCGLEPERFGAVLLSSCRQVARQAAARAQVLPAADPEAAPSDQPDQDRNRAAFSIWRAASATAPA